MLKNYIINSCMFAAIPLVSFGGQITQKNTLVYHQRKKISAYTIKQNKLANIREKINEIVKISNNRKAQYQLFLDFKKEKPYIQKYIACSAQIRLKKFLIDAHYQGQPLIDADYDYIFYLTHILSPNKQLTCNIPLFALNLIINEKKVPLPTQHYHAYVQDHLTYLKNFITLLEEKKSHLLPEQVQCALYFYLNDIQGQPLNHVQDKQFFKLQLSEFQYDISNPIVTQKICLDHCLEYATQLNNNYLKQDTTLLFDSLSRWRRR